MNRTLNAYVHLNKQALQKNEQKTLNAQEYQVVVHDVVNDFALEARPQMFRSSYTTATTYFMNKRMICCIFLHVVEQNMSKYVFGIHFI